jgi:hypothetical protein
MIGFSVQWSGHAKPRLNRAIIVVIFVKAFIGRFGGIRLAVLTPTSDEPK